jgi:hypothetical protein
VATLTLFFLANLDVPTAQVSFTALLVPQPPKPHKRRAGPAGRGVIDGIDGTERVW